MSLNKEPPAVVLTTLWPPYYLGLKFSDGLFEGGDLRAEGSRLLRVCFHQISFWWAQLFDLLL